MILVVGVAVLRGGRVLAARKSSGGWEFPGGKVEPGETPAQAAVREVEEELGCTVAVSGWLDPEVDIRPGLRLRVATGTLVAGEPIPRHGEHDAVRWLAPQELGAVEWLAADQPFVTVLGAH